MRQLDQIIPQDVKRVRSNDRCAEASMRHDKDSWRSQYDNHRDGGNDFESQHQ